MSNDEMNRFLREARSGPSFDLDAASGDVNAAIPEAAGYPTPAPTQQQHPSEPPRDPRTATRRLLAEAAQVIRDAEPIPGLHSERKWTEWVWSRGTVTLLDQEGRLPGERGYKASTTAEALGADWDVEQAISARKDRWHNLGR